MLSLCSAAIGCVICGKPARKDSAYCSDACVAKFSDNVKSDASEKEKNKPPTPPSTPTSAQSKLKVCEVRRCSSESFVANEIVSEIYSVQIH